MTSASKLRPSQPPPSYSWANIAKILGACEHAPAGTSGALLIQTKNNEGSVFIEAGRICWVAATGLDRRLAHLLRERCHALSSETLEDVRQWCVNHQVPFGEALVNSGMLTERELRNALEQHSVESLLVLSTEPVETLRWVARSARNYDAKFTFSPIALLNSASIRDYPDAHHKASAHLARVLRGGGSGAAFIQAGEDVRCVAVHEVAWAIDDLLEIGRRACTAHGLAEIVMNGARALIVAQPTGGAVTVWRRESIVYVAVGRDAGALSIKMAALDAALSVLDTSPSKADT
ncbi:MAG: hypothetical protein IPG04_07550 [Polyangiaceae bacterium]|jgi:hypothetical protein|nr:hypothetical protein [Polyangiaceae bacterium]